MKRITLSIDKLKENENLTVAQLLNKLEEENKLLKENENNTFNSIKEEFNNTYFIGHTNCTFFGKTLEVLHIEEITSQEKNTEWELIYRVKGKRIAFSKRDINSTDIKNILNLNTIRKEYKKISKDDFNQYKEKYQSIVNNLSNIINTEL